MVSLGVEAVDGDWQGMGGVRSQGPSREFICRYHFNFTRLKCVAISPFNAPAITNSQCADREGESNPNAQLLGSANSATQMRSQYCPPSTGSPAYSISLNNSRHVFEETLIG